MSDNISDAEKTARLVAKIKRAHDTATILNKNAIGEFVRFEDTIIAVSEIQSVQAKKKELINGYHVCDVEIDLKPAAQVHGCSGRTYYFKNCKFETFEKLSDKLGV